MAIISRLRRPGVRSTPQMPHQLVVIGVVLWNPGTGDAGTAQLLSFDRDAVDQPVDHLLGNVDMCRNNRFTDQVGDDR